MTRLARLALVAAFIFLHQRAVCGDENWASWRGPGLDGVAAEGVYPTKWSATENIIWQYELPGIGASTPIIWGDKLFLTGAADGKNSVLCVDLNGKKQWLTQFGEERPAKNRKASGSNSSPVTDGQFIFAYFKSGELACLDFAGKLIWKQNLQEMYGEDTLWWDLGSSPVLTSKGVVITCMQTGNSYVACFEKESGKELWKQDRNVEAPGESAQSYTTPVVVNRGGREEIVVLGADHVTSHHVSDGKLIWQVRELNPRGIQNYRSISSPVLAQGHIVVPYGRGSTVTAIRLGGTGDVTSSHVAWNVVGRFSDVPSPAAHKDKVYFCSDRGQVFALAVKDGKVVQTIEVPRSRASFSASPIVANDHLYLINEEGTTYVISLGKQMEVVGENRLDDFAVATPIFHNGRIYIRTDKHVHCIGSKPTAVNDAP
jgi:outer membrane protein assembly factor BamB